MGSMRRRYGHRPPRGSVGETFAYTATVRNGGGMPCNWVSLTVALPGEVDFVSASSAAPLTRRVEPAVRIVGLPFDVACRGGPGFLLWPGGTVSAAVTVRALRTGTNVRATAVADPGNACFESREGNNAASSAATVIILRPRLRVALNRPFPPSTGRPVRQIFPVPITNVGAGPAIGIAVSVAQGSPGGGPEIAVAYKGDLLGGHGVPTNPIPSDCPARICVLAVTLQPGERLQVHFRSTPLCGSVPIAVPDIRVGTSDEPPQDAHVARLREACGP
jgi:uncharacterized repeat protein (TIGR01451 family)